MQKQDKEKIWLVELSSGCWLVLSDWWSFRNMLSFAWSWVSICFHRNEALGPPQLDVLPSMIFNKRTNGWVPASTTMLSIWLVFLVFVFLFFVFCFFVFVFLIQLLPIFWDATKFIAKVVVQVYIHTSNEGVFHYFHNLNIMCCPSLTFWITLIWKSILVWY